MKDSKGRTLKAPEVEEETDVVKDYYGKVIKQKAKEEKPKDVKMIQDGSMQQNIDKANEEGERFVKH